MKRKWKIAAAVVCVLALVTVAYAATSGSAGSQSDPLITLSYLTNVFTPKVEDTVEQAVAGQQAENEAALDSAISEWDSKVQQAISQAGVSGSGGAAYKTVTLNEGQTLHAGEGCEVLLRSGAVTWTAEGVTMLDTTSGGELSTNQKLAANHLYVTLGTGDISVAGSSQSSETTGTITASTLNVRSGAGSSYDKVGTLKEGDTVVITGSSNGWYQITSGSLSGYVSGDYVTVNVGSSSGSGSGAATLLVRGTYSIG